MTNALSSNWFIFLPLAFSLFVAMRLAEGSIDRARHSSTALILRSLIALLFLFSLLAIGLRANPLGFVWLALLSFWAFIFFRKNRRLEQSAMLLTALNAHSVVQQYSVAESFWTENRGWIRRKAKALRQDLGSGLPWWSALESRGLAKGVYAKLALRLFARYGVQGKRPSGETRRAELLAPLQIELEAERLLARFMLFSWIAFVAPIIGLILVFLVPTILQTFQEFGLEPPVALSQLSAVSQKVSNFGGMGLLSLATLAVLAVIGAGLLLWLDPQLFQRRGLQWLVGDYYRNLGFAALSRAIEEEPEMTQACRATAELVVVREVSRQFAFAAQKLSEGAQPRDAFVKSGLLSHREFAISGFGLNECNSAWSLQQLASWKTARMLDRYSMIVQLAVVLLTLLIALVIGTLAVGMIEALSILISSLA